MSTTVDDTTSGEFTYGAGAPPPPRPFPGGAGGSTAVVAQQQPQQQSSYSLYEEAVARMGYEGSILAPQQVAAVLDNAVVGMRSRSGQHLQARDGENGAIFMTTNPLREWEEWLVEALPDRSGGVRLRSYHGSYLRAPREGGDYSTTFNPRASAIFTLNALPHSDAASGDSTAVTTQSPPLRVTVFAVWEGCYLHAPPPTRGRGEEPVRAVIAAQGDPECYFDVVVVRPAPGVATLRGPMRAPVGDVDAVVSRRIALRSHHGTYLQAHGNGWIRFTTNPIGDCERFAVEENDDGTVCLRTLHGTYVTFLPLRERLWGARNPADPCARFAIVPIDGRQSKVAVVTCVGSHLHAPHPGLLKRTDEYAKGTGDCGDWELFEIIDV
jgi:hypothetical protein